MSFLASEVRLLSISGGMGNSACGGAQPLTPLSKIAILELS